MSAPALEQAETMKLTMNPVLERLVRDRQFVGPTGELITSHSEIKHDVGALLQRLITESRARTCLEVGMAFGISSLFMCDALAAIPDSRLIVIDPAQNDPRWWKGFGLHNVRTAGYERMVEFHELPSYQALALLDRDRRSIDFAFIDGRHRFDYVMTDFFFIDKLLKVGGLMVFDDADWPGVRKALRYIVTNEPYSVHATACPDRWKRRAREWLLRVPPRWFNKQLPPANVEIGLAAHCVALRKEDPSFRPPPPNRMKDGADNSELFAFRDF